MAICAANCRSSSELTVPRRVTVPPSTLTLTVPKREVSAGVCSGAAMLVWTTVGAGPVTVNPTAIRGSNQGC
jgi:hypothetical protein